MKKTLLAVSLSLLIGLPVWAALKVSDRAPDFSARASLAGKEFTFSLPDALKKGPVVVYFYPSAFTGGCNIEAHTFAENKEKLINLALNAVRNSFQLFELFLLFLRYGLV